MMCQSTSEAEFVPATECVNVNDILWLWGLRLEIGFHIPPTPVYEDNQVTIVMIKNHMVSVRNRHFCIRMV